MAATMDPRFNPLGTDTFTGVNEATSIDARSFEQAIWSGSSTWGSADSPVARSFSSLSSDSTLVDSDSDDIAGLHEKQGMFSDGAEFSRTMEDTSTVKNLSSTDKSVRETSTSIPAASATRETESIQVAIYSTERRLKVQDCDKDDDDWMPHFNLSYTVVSDDDMSLVVYLNDEDISDLVDAEHGSAMTLFKSEGDPENKKRDYTFRIVIDPGVEESQRTFDGTWFDNKGEWEWRGKYFLEGKRNRVKSEGIEYGPDGKSTIQQLLMLSSLNHEGKDIAQQEGDRIFGKILLDSIPNDVKTKLYPDLPKLDKEERMIKNLGPDYLPRAAVVNLLSHLQGSKDVAAAQRARIDKIKCDAFFPACMSTKKPLGAQDDPVKTFGWDREKDAAIINKVQQQSRTIASDCYRLGYIRAVTSFQMFLDDASYWYKRLAGYLESSAHLRRFSHRVRSRDTHLERDVYDWYNKLTLLHNACGDIDGAAKIDGPAKIEDVMASLQGASTLATLHDVEYNDDFKAHLKNFFEELDQIDNDPLKSEDEDYAKLQQLMAIRGANSWSELGKTIISTLNAHTNYLHRIPTISEVATLLARQEAASTLSGNPWLLPVKAHMRPALIASGIVILINTLMQQKDSLSISEQITMYMSLVQGILLEPSLVLAPVRCVALGFKSLARGIGWCLKKVMPERSLGFIKAASAFSTKVVRVGSTINGVLEKLCRGITFVFGFFVSCFCIWAAFDEFLYAKKHGQTVDKWFAGAELLLTAASFITMVVQLGALWYLGTAGAPIVAFCGTVGVVLMATGLVVAIAALVVGVILKEDPVKDLIDKYGRRYKLLKY